MYEKRTILALVGRAVCGKDTVGDYLEKNYGFVKVSTGQLVRDYIEKAELGQPTRDLMIKVANDVRSEHGDDYFVQKALETDVQRLNVDGLRAMGEIKAIKNTGAIIIAIDATKEKRFQWANIRGRVCDKISFEDFVRQEKIESINKSASVQSIDTVMSSADYTIKNDQDLISLFTKVDALMTDLGISK